MGEVAVNLNNFCYEFENSYFNDNDVTSILNNGVTPENILNALRIIKDKEKSKFIKLPMDFQSYIKKVPTNISFEDLPKIAEALYRGEELKAILGSIELARDEDIILRVLGPFSTLLQSLGSNTLFKWLFKYKNQVHSALTIVTEAQVAYINSALREGVNIISFAEPSAMEEVIGEKCYREFVMDYTIKLLKSIEANLDKSILHICPKTSYQLERYGVITSEVLNYCGNSYAQALIELAQNNNIKYIGHRCINAEHVKVDKIYVLKFL